MMADALAILAVALSAGATALGVAALTARALFVSCAYLSALAALAAAAALLMGAGDGALALAVFGVALGPVLILCATLLSAPAVRARRSFPWLSIAMGVGAALVLFAATMDLTPASRPVVGQQTDALGFWLAPLLLVSAAACVGLLGYGERGAFARRTERREP